VIKEKMIEDLARTIRARHTILFAGAGISMTVGLPSWSDFIDHLLEELDLGADTSARDMGYQTLAEYYRLKHGSLGPLRSAAPAPVRNKQYRGLP
jgi:hypothetical protein